VEEADRNLTAMKLAIARSCVIALHKMFIPNANTRMKETLLATTPEIVLKQVASELTPKAIEKAFIVPETIVQQIKLPASIKPASLNNKKEIGNK
jgi:hypothetical protein